MATKRWLAVLGGCLAAWALVPASARAQVIGPHHQTLIVGDRSMGLGTAFTGLANDGSAVYYNPGGLVDQKRAAITGGFWLSAFDKKRLDDGLQLPFGDFNIHSRRSPSFPAFVASSVSLGKKRSDGQRPFVIAVSSFRGRTDQFHSSTEMVDPDTGLPDTIDVDHSEEDTYFGVSFAWRARRVRGLGVSVFLVRRSYYHRESGFVVAGSADVDTSLGASLLNSISANNYLAVLRFGVLHDLTSRFRGGLALQLPGIPLKSKASRRYQNLHYDLSVDPGDASYVFNSQKGMKARLPMPLELRVGGAFRPLPGLTWTQDVSLVVPVVDRETLPGERAFASAGESPLFVPVSTRGVPVVNVATGIDVAWGRALSVQLGAFTDLSSAPRVPATAAIYSAPRMHRVGITSALGVRGKNRGMAVGFAVLLGRGKALAANADTSASLSGYERSVAHSRTIFVSLTGAIEAAEHLARAAAKRVVPGVADDGKTPAASPSGDVNAPP